jgi:hypothetical protein
VELTRDAVHARYALWLAWGTRIGLAFLVAGFTAYMLGLAPHVPIEQLPALWERPATELLERTGLAPGWQWASLAHRSDMLVLAAIAFLASCSIACLAAVIPLFLERGERLFVAVCALQIVVLLVAASGLLAVGH